LLKTEKVVHKQLGVMKTNRNCRS